MLLVSLDFNKNYAHNLHVFRVKLSPFQSLNEEYDIYIYMFEISLLGV